MGAGSDYIAPIVLLIEVLLVREDDHLHVTQVIHLSFVVSNAVLTNTITYVTEFRMQVITWRQKELKTLEI